MLNKIVGLSVCLSHKAESNLEHNRSLGVLNVFFRKTNLSKCVPQFFPVQTDNYLISADSKIVLSLLFLKFFHVCRSLVIV